MSQQSIRQSEIFAGEDWTVLYRAFTQINFNAYDPASINAALRSYIQANYPEEFNDWIESSEFVAIIDLLSWLAGSLAFRTDVNARENFLESAEARESVLRLARFLSYNPRRANSGRGLVKITEIRSSAPLEDSFGVNLTNRTIKWNDPDNPDWFEQFTIVLNATFPTTNPYGIPVKTATITNQNQLYKINCLTNPRCVYPFQAKIDGSTYPFEIVNVDIETDLGYFERSPNPDNGHHIIYRNDGKGNNSARTGFFMFFKQGTLSFQDVAIRNPIENRLIDIETPNISETDVWTQTLASDSSIDIQWIKVPAIFSENITFNSIAPENRDIFSVITRDDDNISLRFGDGRFGNVPIGDMRVWYRTVNGQQYQIRPRDINQEQVVIPYLDADGRTYNLTLGFSLMENVSNAVAAEDLDQIRQRAPQVYGSQNRMVSGEDYNVFPLSSNNVVKMRAVNRVYSGHSRFLNINDPTSTLQDTVVFGDDGALYREDVTQYTQVPISNNITNEQIVSRKIQPLLDSLSLRDYFLSKFVDNIPYLHKDNITWGLTSSVTFNSTGYFVTSLPAMSVPPTFEELERLSDYQADLALVQRYFSTGCQLKFRIPATLQRLESYVWAKVVTTTVTTVNFDSIYTQGGTVILNESIPHGAELVQVIPPFRSKLDNRAFVQLNGHSEVQSIQELITARKPFKLYYLFGEKSTPNIGNYEVAGRWIVVEPGDTRPADTVSTLVLDMKYVAGVFWAINVLVGSRFIFESIRDVRWNNIHKHKVVDATTGVQQRDRITLTSSKIIPKVALNGDLYTETEDIKIGFDIRDNVFDPDGYPDFRKVIVSPSDIDDDGSVDNPDAFNIVMGLAPTRLAGPRLVKFVIDPKANYSALVMTPDQNEYGTPSEPNVLPVTKMGVPNLRFQWKHYVNTDVRIDPAITNIIDLFVLTREYDFLTRQWIAQGSDPLTAPIPPTNLDLKIALQEFEQYKMFSDQIIWRPVKYKYLFGELAQPELKAQFKVIRLPNSPLSDGEIRSKVIQAVNNYFDVNKWEFGETFYFTELAAYIHLQLATSISSVVIVPLSNNGKFGELFEIRSGSDEVFISTAQVSDVVIIDGNTMSNLRIS